ncbi:tetratricopeptide repeat protein [Streptomyces sp. GC420]|uniref:tetratricopeptide repeat protein n=1 Tax=Streptomyces sp. GC420 TaxID=2697568 RepID=UPI0014152379|nr:tetratricopeptide repeat protein [Streptomyces sp. GC420]NBM18070.1 tetratricopeptide repeat protein [Streptomyces sp. GC420]
MSGPGPGLGPRLREAVELRSAGRPEEARRRLLDLCREHPDHAGVAYQTAWTHDVLGLEAEALPHYERALDRPGLSPRERAGAWLGLGSTHRVLGRYEDALATFDRGLGEFPGDQALRTFRAMALYNLGQAREAVGALLKVLAATTGDAQLRSYRRALEYYADDLDGVVGEAGAAGAAGGG